MTSPLAIKSARGARSALRVSASLSGAGGPRLCRARRHRPHGHGNLSRRAHVNGSCKKSGGFVADATGMVYITHAKGPLRRGTLYGGAARRELGGDMSQGTRGLAAFALGFGLVAGGIALARGPDMNMPVFGAVSGGFFGGSQFLRLTGPTAPRAPTTRASAIRETRRPRRGRRVRLRQAAFACASATDRSSRPLRSPAARRPARRSAPTRRPRSTPCRPTASRTRSPRPACSVHQAAGRQALSDQFRKHLHLPSRQRRLARQGDLHDNTLRKGDVVMTATVFAFTRAVATDLRARRISWRCRKRGFERGARDADGDGAGQRRFPPPAAPERGRRAA